MSAFLQSLSQALSESIAQAQGSVVSIAARRRFPASGLVWSTAGVVVTANHVIQNEDDIQVTLANGATHVATLVGRDPTTDLAAVRVLQTGLAALPIARLEGLKVGHFAVALGRPGASIQATLGMVSSVGEKWRTPFGGVLDTFLRADITMYPGFSGGPLLNAQGEVLGLNSSALSRHYHVAIPATTIGRVTEELLQHGRVRRGYLGIGVHPVELPDGLRRQTHQENGLLVVSVAPDSPAERHGLLLGDTIVAVDGQPLEQMEQLLASLSSDRIQQEIGLSIVRAGQSLSLKIRVGENV